MPYNYPDNVPDSIKGLPAGAQKLWISVFNKALDAGGDEREANIKAWAMVKRGYTTSGDGKTWVQKAKALVLLEDLGGSPPEWIRVLKMGENRLNDGRDSFLVDKRSIGRILAAFQMRGNDLVVDYEHATMKTNGEAAPAAGWIQELEARDDGLWARISWTNKGADFIRAREYRYFSPVVKLDKERRVTELLNVALTNFPALAKIEALAAKFGELDIEAYASTDADKAAQEERAKKFKIGIKPGGAVTKPSEWADVPDAQWGDPVNYSYPLPDLDQTMAAWRYWGVADNRKPYNSQEISIITDRIKARGKALGKELTSPRENTQGGKGLMPLNEIRKILALGAEASDLDLILAVRALSERAAGAELLKGKLDEMEKRATKAEGEVVQAKERVSTLEAQSNNLRLPVMVTAALGVEATATAESAITAIEGFKAQVEDGRKAKEELVKLRADLTQAEADRLIDWAMAKGRTSSVELAKDDNRLFNMATSDPKTFKAIMDSRPDNFMTPAGQRLQVNRDDKGNAVILTADDKKMCESLGVDEADYLKAKTESVQTAVQAAAQV